MTTLFLASILSMAFVAQAEATPGSSIVGLWRFDEGTGTTAYDSSGYNNHGTISGDGDIWVPGKFGTALSFDGNDWVVVLDSPSLEPTSITVEAWVKRSGSPGAYRYVVSKYLPNRYGSYCSYGLYTGSGGGMRFYIGYTTSWVASPAIAPTTIWDGQWHHVAGTFDTTTNSLKLYFDGNQVDGTVSTIQEIYYYGTGDLYIGAYTSSSWLAFSGAIDEVRIWDQALTPGQVMASYDLRLGTEIKEKDLDGDGYPDVIFTSAFYELESGGTITATILPVNPLVTIDYGATYAHHVTPKGTVGWITKGTLSASGYSLPITVNQGTPPCKSIHIWLYLTTGDHLGVNAQFLPYG